MKNLFILTVIIITMFFSCDNSSSSNEINKNPQGTIGGVCYSNGTCNANLTCVNNICNLVEYGEEGKKCYPNNTCNDSLVCENNLCIKKDIKLKGTIGGECYENQTCNESLQCINGICEEIEQGTEGGYCFPNEICVGNLVCNRKNICSSPLDGSLNGNCYLNKTCDNNLFCNESNICIVLEDGELNGKCLPENICNTGLYCKNNICEQYLYGGLNLPCYPNETCNENLVCNSENKCVPQETIEMGFLNGFCYPNNTCNENLICENNLCVEQNYIKIINNVFKYSSPSFVNFAFNAKFFNNNQNIFDLAAADFDVFEDNIPISTSEAFLKVKKYDDFLQKEIYSVILIDVSANTNENIDLIKQSIKNLIQNSQNQKWAIVTFSDNYSLIQNFTDDKQLLNNKIDTIQIGYNVSNLNESVIYSLNLWEEFYDFQNGILNNGFVLIITDGNDTTSINSVIDIKNNTNNKLIHTVCLGDEIDYTLMSEFNNGGFTIIDNLNNLQQKIVDANNQLLNELLTRYFVTYLSPKRTGSHTTTLKIKNNIENSDSVVQSVFDANSFYSVRNGIYVNDSKENQTGIDAVLINISQNNELNLILNSYFINNFPSFELTFQNNNIAETEFINNQQVKLKAKQTGNTSLTIKDVNNNLTKIISVKVVNE